MDWISISRNLKQDFAEFFHGRRWSFPPELRRARKISEALEHIRQRWPEAADIYEDSEKPVFIFSAGWRSGSTLIQRLLLSSGEIVVWGEPLGDAALIPRLSYSLSFITEKWPPETFFCQDVAYQDLQKKWVANFTPEICYLRLAHRYFFLKWFKTPAQERFGLNRWGIKEVRLTIDHARYLKWLFPQARFIFVFRHPCHAFRSWRGNKWRSQWPGYYPYSATAFAHHWRLLMEGFLSGASEVDGILVKFEDLVSGKIELEKIAHHVGVSQFDESVLQQKINSPREIVKRPKISLLDRTIISFICRSLMQKVGYI